MRNIWTIAKREYKIYFSSPLAYLVMLTIIFVVGIIFALNIIFLVNNPFGSGQAPDTRSQTQWIVILLVFLSPALTMRLLADEQRMGTLELIVGKWLGSFLFVLTIIALSLVFPFFTNSMVTPGIDQQMMLSGYLGVILISSAFLAIGTGISSMFSNQFAAFFMTFIILLALYFIVGAPAQILNTNSELFSYLDMGRRFSESLNQGIINLSDIVYFLSVTALGLFIGSLAIETRRWR